MALFILDTDTCSYIMKRSHPHLLEKIKLVPLAEQAISVVTLAELMYGLKLSGSPEKARAVFDDFIRYPAVLDWDRAAGEHYADIRADLKRRGEMIGANDLMIAAHARSLGATLITNNMRELVRVSGLVVENWAAP